MAEVKRKSDDANEKDVPKQKIEKERQAGIRDPYIRLETILCENGRKQICSNVTIRGNI